MTKAFKVGDRVKLQDPERWLLPLRKFGHEQRPATVTMLGGDGCFRGQYRVQFDVKRRNARPVIEWMCADDLMLVDQTA